MSIISPNYLPFVQLLVANNAYNNIPDSIRKFLFISAKNSKLLLAKNSKLLLMRAINNNNIPMVKLLLDNGADVNIIDIHQEPPLLCAIKKKQYKNCKIIIR
jgi:ankyrin repeat protein